MLSPAALEGDDDVTQPSSKGESESVVMNAQHVEVPTRTLPLTAAMNIGNIWMSSANCIFRSSCVASRKKIRVKPDESIKRIVHSHEDDTFFRFVLEIVHLPRGPSVVSANRVEISHGHFVHSTALLLVLLLLLFFVLPCFLSSALSCAASSSRWAPSRRRPRLWRKALRPVICVRRYGSNPETT